MDAPALLVMLPPPSISAPVPPDVIALSVRELARGAPPPPATTPATVPEMDAPVAFVKVPPAARSTARAPVMVPALATALAPPAMKTPNALPEMDAPELLVMLP